MLLGLQLVALLGFGAGGLRPPRSGGAEPVLAQPAGVRRLRPVRRGRAALPVHLLGLGRADHRQRGDQGQRPDARPGRRDLDGAAARHLPVHRVRRDQLRGHGTDGLGLGNPDNAADVLATLGPPVLGTALAKVVQFAICVSAISALLTCVISSPRTTLSMASHGALPKAFSRIHPTLPHARLRHRVLRSGGGRPAGGAGDGVGQLPRRRHPVDRPTDRLLLRSHRPWRASGTSAGG